MQNLLAPDTVSQWLAFRGLSGQGKKGLLAIVDDMMKNEEKSLEKLRQKLEILLTWPLDNQKKVKRKLKKVKKNKEN